MPIGMGVKMKKSIITVVGKDTVGIIAKVCTYLAEIQINILDISQTIVQGYFNMMMIVDATASEKQSGKIADELAVLGEEIGVQINGKLKSTIVIPTDADKDQVLAIAKADEKVQKAMGDKNIVKEIYVPNKIVNIVVK